MACTDYTVQAAFVHCAGVKMINLMGSSGTKAVAAALLGAEVTCIDISPANVQYGQQLAKVAGVDVQFVVADVLSLPAEVDAGEMFTLYKGRSKVVLLRHIRISNTICLMMYQVTSSPTQEPRPALASSQAHIQLLDTDTQQFPNVLYLCIVNLDCALSTVPRIQCQEFSMSRSAAVLTL